MGLFFFGLMLIAISYLVPLIYMPFDIRSIPVSLTGTLYLVGYLFVSSTMKSNLNYLFKIMMFANLLLTFQVFFYLYQGYLLNPDLDIYHRIFIGWGRNLGWANINDMCFYIALTFPSYLYFIFKKPNTYLLWMLMILPTAAVILSKSRGGMIGYAVVIVGVVLFFLWKGNKKHLTHGLVALLVAGILSYLGREIFYLWYDELILSFGNNLNDFSSNRLYIYENAWRVFKQYPLFGGGWLSINSFPFNGRIFMYHSTIFQALAAMGLFGLFALIVHYTQILKYMLKHPTLEKYLFLIGYLASQVHGLIDNVQYSVPYSILIALILALFETSNQQTLFEEVNERYHLISTT
jgi:O-antigen ligase